MKKQLTIKKNNGHVIVINMRCNDECNNGHDPFAITGEYYEPTRKRNADAHDLREFNGKMYEMTKGGCIHDEILKVRPSLKLLADLHLSDGDGVPMYALENGYYHLQGYMGTAAYNHTMTAAAVAEYLRVPEAEIIELAKTNPTKLDFAAYINGKREQWRSEAEAGRKLIESIN